MTTQEHKPLSERIEIESPDGITLRQLVESDAQAYHDALHNDPARFKHGEEMTLKKYPTVKKVLESINDPDPRKLRLGIWDGELMVGSVNLTFNRPKSAELGYWSGYKGQDYSERGARLLVGYAFSNFDLDRITAWAASENIGSRTVLERLGFRKHTDGFHQLFYELNKDDANHSMS